MLYVARVSIMVTISLEVFVWSRFHNLFGFLSYAKGM